MGFNDKNRFLFLALGGNMNTARYLDFFILIFWRTRAQHWNINIH